MRSGTLHDPILQIAMKAASTNWKKSLKPSRAATTLPNLFVDVMSPQSVFTDCRQGICDAGYHYDDAVDPHKKWDACTAVTRAKTINPRNKRKSTGCDVSSPIPRFHVFPGLGVYGVAIVTHQRIMTRTLSDIILRLRFHLL